MEEDSESIQKQITKEFANLFTALSSRVQVFQTTQKDFLDTLTPTIAEVLPILNAEELETAAAIYGISLTDEAIKGYEISHFAEDIKYLRSLIPDEEVKEKIDEVKETSSKPLIEQLEDPSSPESTETPEEPDTTSPEPSQQPRTLAERAKQAIESETVFMKVLTAYYQANSSIEKSLVNFNNDLILHHINERPEIVITSLLIRGHFLRLYTNIVKIYEAIPIEVDLRFVSAQIQIAVERLLDPKAVSESQAAVFLKIKERYPLAYGEDLYWDLSEQVLYSKYYPKIKEMLQPQIDEAKREKELARESLLNSMERSKVQPQQGSIESIRSKVDSLIFEVFQFHRAFDDNSRVKMQKAVESVLKRMALLEYGSQDIPDLSKFTQYFTNEFFKPIFDEYPQMYLPFTDIRLYRDFVDDPKTHIEKHQDYIVNQFWFKMRRHTRTSNPGSSQLAHAFAMVMYDILNDDRVQNFDI